MSNATHGGKGDRQRKVNAEKYSSNFDAIFKTSSRCKSYKIYSGVCNRLCMCILFCFITKRWSMIYDIILLFVGTVTLAVAIKLLYISELMIDEEKK